MSRGLLGLVAGSVIMFVASYAVAYVQTVRRDHDRIRRHRGSAVATAVAVVVAVIWGVACSWLAEVLFGIEHWLASFAVFMAAVFTMPDLLEAIGRRHYGHAWRAASCNHPDLLVDWADHRCAECGTFVNRPRPKWSK